MNGGQFVLALDAQLLVAHLKHQHNVQFCHIASLKVHNLLTNTGNILVSRSRDLSDDGETYSCAHGQNRCADSRLHLHHAGNVADHHTQVNHAHMYHHYSS